MTVNWKTSACSHDRATQVIKVGKARIWAGAQSELLERFGWQLVISAIGYTKFNAAPLTASESAHELLPKALFAWAPPPCVGIDWPDCGIPALSGDWWDTLATALRGLDGDIGLCCFGGHGRTGVMLAVLAVKLGKVKKGGCPVAWVRKRYCDKAVETCSQLEYIERVTGVKVMSEASGIVASTSTWPASYSYPGAVAAVGVGKTGVISHTDAPRDAAANPTPPSPTPSGSAAGWTDERSDDELLAVWFADGDIKVPGDDGFPQFIRPVWDHDGGLAGWQSVPDSEEG